MKRLIGICHNSPHTVESLLKQIQTRVDFSYTFIFDADKKVNFDHDVIVFVGHTMLNRHSKDVANKTVILIDSPVFCCNYENIALIDAVRKKSFQFVFLPLTLDALVAALKTKNKVKYAPIDVIPTLLRDMPSSVLHPVQTYLYKIADVDMRQQYQYIIFKTIKEGGNLAELSFLQKKTKPVTDLLAWYATPEGTNACNLLNKALNAKTRNYDQLESEFGVAKFDIRYAMNVIRKSTVEVSDDDTVQLYEARKAAKAVG
jgi:hypothetical protein